MDVVGFEGGVRFELALPVTLLSLEGKEVLRTALDGLFQTRGPVLCALWNWHRRDRDFFSHPGE
jgi:hypothetical protein